MKYLGAITNNYNLVTKKYVDDATEVIQTLTSGTKIGSVGGVNLYAPTGGGSGTITKVKTTAGAHTAIDVSSGAANFNVPTKTSHLTNDSGFLYGSGFFKIVTVELSNSAQIAAHGYQGAQTVTVPSASRPTGMTLVGVVGQSTTNYRLVSSTCYVNGTHSISANMANTSSTAVNANSTITFYLLCIKATEA
jgi:hypothetical protein